MSQLCAVMSMPSQEAFNAALHMVAYVYSQKDRGIRFSSDGNLDLLTLYDAYHCEYVCSEKAIDYGNTVQ